MELVKLPMISLQRQALTNFASSVWISANQTYLKLPLEIDRISMNDRAIDELNNSDIAKHIKEMTMMILTDVGNRISAWLHEIRGHVNDTTLELQVANLSWTVEGSLNPPKIARLILENQTDLDLSFSFRMACEYCLEDKVRELWPRIREERELDDFNAEDLMVKYWIYKLDGHLLDISDPYVDALLESDETSIDVKFFVLVVYDFDIEFAVKFLLNNLSSDEKTQAFDIFYKSWNLNESYLLFLPQYLFSHFNFTQICDFISKFQRPEQLLINICCIQWTTTEFLKAFDHYISKMKGTIEATEDNDLIKFAEGDFKFVQRYNRTILLRYCWTRFPKEELNRAIEDPDSSFLTKILQLLSNNKDAVSINMIIDSIEPKGYAKKLLSIRGLAVIKVLARYDTDLLKSFLARTVYRKSLAVKLLKGFKNYYRLLECKEIVSGILLQLFPALNVQKL